MLMNKWIPTIYSEIRGFLNWKGVLGSYWRGLNDVISRGIFQYVLKLIVLFSMPIGSLSEAPVVNFHNSP